MVGKTYQPNLSPSEGLAYILGAFLGDGTLAINKWAGGRYVMLQVKSKVFVEKFAKALASIGLNPRICRLRARDRWSLQAGSKVLYNFLQHIRETLPESILPFIKTHELKRRFVEGFIDAEGTICIRKNRWKNKSYSYLFVGFYNSSLSLIGLVADTIRQLGFGCGISEHRKGEYQGYILGSQAEKKRFIEFLYHDEDPSKPCEIIETVESE